MYDDCDLFDEYDDYDDYDGELRFDPDDDQDDIMRMIDEYEEKALYSSKNQSDSIKQWYGQVAQYRKNKQWNMVLKISPRKDDIINSYLWNDSVALCLLCNCISRLYQEIPQPDKRTTMEKLNADYLSGFFHICIKQSTMINKNTINQSLHAYWCYYNAIINKILSDAKTAYKLYRSLISISRPHPISYQNQYRYIRDRQLLFEINPQSNRAAYERLYYGYKSLIERKKAMDQNQQESISDFYRKSLYNCGKIGIKYMLDYNKTVMQLLYHYNDPSLIIDEKYTKLDRANLIKELDDYIKECYNLSTHSSITKVLKMNNPNCSDVIYRRSQIALFKGIFYSFRNRDGSKFYRESIQLSYDAIKERNRLKAIGVPIPFFPSYMVKTLSIALCGLKRYDIAINTINSIVRTMNADSLEFDKSILINLKNTILEWMIDSKPNYLPNK